MNLLDEYYAECASEKQDNEPSYVYDYSLSGIISEL